MTRAGLALAALAAAGITAGSIGFAVFWAYGPGDAPVVTSVEAVPPAETASQSGSPPATEVRSPHAEAAPARPRSSKADQRPAVPNAIVTVPAVAPPVASQPPAPIVEPARPRTTKQESAAALPQPPEKPSEAPAVASEPEIGVIRRSRSAAAHPSSPETSKSAARPRSPPAHTETDARPITVLRGGRWPRYAMVAAAEPNSRVDPLPRVIRGGARPRSSAFFGYVQPSALILHIRQ